MNTALTIFLRGHDKVNYLKRIMTFFQWLFLGRRALQSSLSSVQRKSCVNPVLNLSEGQVVFFFGGGWGGRRNLKYRRIVINAAHEKLFGAALKTLGAGTY